MESFGRDEFFCSVIDDWDRSEYFVEEYNKCIYQRGIDLTFSTTSDVKLPVDHQATLGNRFLFHSILGRNNGDGHGLPMLESPLYVLTLQFLTLLANDYKFKFSGIGRSCVNLVLPTKEDDQPQCFYHVDHPYQHLSVLLYLNDGDGDTLLSDKFYNPLYEDRFENNCNLITDPDDHDKVHIKERVSPKRGRILIFNGMTYHTALRPVERERGVVVSTVY